MESTENVYYAESSEIIEEDSTWDMEDVVIVENENLNWHEDEGPEVTVNYGDTSDNPEQTLTENEIYMSTNPEGDNDADKTEYFSILETTYQADDEYDENNISARIVVNVTDEEKMILPDTLNNEYGDEESTKENTDEENLDNQVILYSSDDPNEMYAVQIADDGNGNFQRYKYKVRTNADGQLEAIPGTIEVQDENVDDIIEKTMNNSDNIHIEQEDTEPENITPQNFLSVKEEPTNDNSLDASDMDEEYGTPEYLLSENEIDDEDYLQQHPNDDIGLQLQNNFLEITPDIEEDEVDSINVNDNFDKPVEKKRKFFKTRDRMSSPFYKNNKHDNEIAVYKGDKKLSYLLLNAREKENLEKITEIKNSTPNIKNSRSILKTSFITPDDNKKNNKTNIRMLNNNKNVESKEMTKITKDKTELQLVSRENKIADKSVRQPRKQTIKPIERFGSEIVVQPVYYSVNKETAEFIPAKKKPISTSVDEVVRVSDDSDPDYTDHPKPKKRKPGRKSLKHKKIAHITISDSEHSADEESVIEILTEDIEYLEEEFREDISLNNENEDPTVDLDKSDDITKIQEAVDNIVQEREERKKADKQLEEKKKNTQENGKKDVKNSKAVIKKNNIKCPICPKTFPREINLKTHMNIHNARRSLRTKANEKADTKTEPKNTFKVLPNVDGTKKFDKYYCNKCKLKFLSEIQLKRHLTVHKERKIAPRTTPKKLQMLRKSTGSSLKVPRSINKTKIPERVKLNLITKNVDTKNVMISPRRPFKCEQCSLSFSQRSLLTSHKLTHKQFLCTKCNIKFTSKILLDDHLKKKCGKNDILKQKAIIRSPVKTKGRISQVLHSCVICKLRFPTLERLSEHKNKEHKKQLPVKKSSLQNSEMKSKHSGVPTSRRMQKAIDLMKTKS